ncbi:MAG: NUDIX hydrolase [Deltaproteobacteria bacterium]|nr:NUDIX hydrolase [Deltaproteobacteria bacterium]
MVAVDVAAFTVLDADLKVLLIQRGLPPRALALPGGFVRCGDVARDQGEDLEQAARRELLDETRLPLPQQGTGALPLVQVGVFGAPDRDPRARVIAVAYLAVVPPELAAFVRAGSDAAAVAWYRVAELREVPLAFDHAEIARCALDRLRRDVDVTPLARALVPAAFSVAELRAAVDAVRGRAADPGNFRRRFRHLLDDGVVRPAPGRRVTGRRQAAVFAFADEPIGR